MKNIALKLGLSAEASEDAVVAEVTKIQNRLTEVEATVIPINNRVAALESENQTLLAVQVETDLAKYADRIKPEAKDKFKAQLIANRAGTIELLDGLVPLPPPAAAEIHNREASGIPAGKPDFASLVSAEVKAGKPKSEAIRLIINREPALYQAWRDSGAKSL